MCVRTHRGALTYMRQKQLIDTMDRHLQLPARKAYIAPQSRTKLLSYENVLCNRSSGAGREDFDDLGDKPEWDPEK